VDDDDEAANRLIDEALAEAYANGTHYDAGVVKKMATKDGPGNARRRAVVDLGVGDSVDRLNSAKGERIYGPASVEVIFWPHGEVTQATHELGEAPPMSRNDWNGNYVNPIMATTGRKRGEGYDSTVYEWEGVSKTIHDWFNDERRHPSVTRGMLRGRIKTQKWTVERALTTPKAAPKPAPATPKRKWGEGYDSTVYAWDGVSKTIHEWFKDERCHPSVTLNVLRSRIKTQKWTVERALTTPKTPPYGYRRNSSETPS
jgi:hypothetical protein